MVLETHMKLCMEEPDFAGKIFFAPKIGKKWTQPKWAKNRIF